MFKKKHTLIVLIIISLVYLILFWFPNKVGAQNLSMISIFEPDEFAQYPHLLRMLEFKGETIRHKIWHFVAYQHYYYGFPFYAYSAIMVGIKNIVFPKLSTQSDLLVLREFVSVLPMILSIGLMVYLRTKFERFFSSVFLFVFLLAIPAVVKNSLWWHPDSLALLFTLLVFYFLVRDEYRYRGNFFIAAVFVGLSIGTKMLGWFFVLTIPIYLMLGVVEKHINIGQMFQKSALFLLIMFATILVSNPALLSPIERNRIISIQSAQAEAMGFGWGVAYPKGLKSWLGLINEYYGNLLLISLSTLGLCLGIFRKNKKLLDIFILSWLVPFLVYILFFVAIKPIHLLIPAVIPLYSGLDNILFEIESISKPKWRIFAAIGFAAVVGFQTVLFIEKDRSLYTNKLSREISSPAIQYYQDLAGELAGCLESDTSYKVFRDVRAYFPESEQFSVGIRWGLIDFSRMKEINPDIFIITRQTVLDYTAPGTLEISNNPQEMERVIKFLSEVESGDIEGYKMFFKNDFAYTYLRESLINELDCEY